MRLLPAVGGGDRVEALEQPGPLLAGGGGAELPGHDVVLGAAEQAGLRLGDLDHQVRLFGVEIGQLSDDPAHLVRLFGGDLQVGVGDAREDVGEAGEVAGLRRIQALEPLGDGADRRGLALRPLALAFETEEAKQGHAGRLGDEAGRG